MGAGASAEAYAAGQTEQLLGAIRANERIRELVINPLMLTVIAMVHRDRVKLPDRRAELYSEAVDVLLGKWEEVKGLREVPILEGKPFDTGDKRLMLQSVALAMHERQHKEVAVEDLRRWLGEMFYEILRDEREAERAVRRFLSVIEERTGLLVARGEGVYAFSHLTFQEYLAAVAVAARTWFRSFFLGCVLISSSVGYCNVLWFMVYSPANPSPVERGCEYSLPDSYVLRKGFMRMTAILNLSRHCEERQRRSNLLVAR